MQANNVNQRRRAQGSAFKNALSALWHLPDRFHWMAPLPYPHRRGVLLAVLLMLVAFLWPAGSGSPDAPASDSRSETAVPLAQGSSSESTQAPATSPTAQNSVEPPPMVESGAAPSQPSVQTQESTTTPAGSHLETAQASAQPPTEQQSTEQASSTPAATAEGEWKEFTIQRGHTLTQVFRDNHLVVNDAFLLAQVEGPGNLLTR